MKTKCLACYGLTKVPSIGFMTTRPCVPCKGTGQVETTEQVKIEVTNSHPKSAPLPEEKPKEMAITEEKGSKSYGKKDKGRNED